MLYIVGGASRSGKSLLAGRMNRRLGVPWFPLDSLMMSLHRGAPLLGINPDGDDLETADRMWPFVEPVLDHLLFDGRDYLVEGTNLRPETISRYIGEADEPVCACFLGYPDACIETKAAQVEAHDGLPTDWLHRTGPDNVQRHLRACRALSRDLREKCAKLGVPFVDTGKDFFAGLKAAELILTQTMDP